MLPRGGDLVWGEGKYKSDWPLFLYGNVFVLPGVPQFFKTKLDTILHSFIPARQVFLSLFYFFRVSSRFRVLFIFYFFVSEARHHFPLFHPRAKGGSSRARAPTQHVHTHMRARVYVCRS